MSPRAAVPFTGFGFVGNLGCIRFPQPVRKAAGVKRGDRLIVLVHQEGSVLLEKLEAPGGVEVEEVTVEGCACEQPPEQCGRGPREVVTVGWSYVQLNGDLATEMGFLPEEGIKLLAEPGQITVTLHDDPDDLKGAERLPCPP